MHFLSFSLAIIIELYTEKPLKSLNSDGNRLPPHKKFICTKVFLSRRRGFPYFIFCFSLKT
jgi:hypothetical protein